MEPRIEIRSQRWKVLRGAPSGVFGVGRDPSDRGNFPPARSVCERPTLENVSTCFSRIQGGFCGSSSCDRVSK